MMWCPRDKALALVLSSTYPMEPPIASHVIPGLDDACRRPVMPQPQEERNQPLNSFLKSHTANSTIRDCC